MIITRFLVALWMLSSSLLVAMQAPALEGDLFTAIPISGEIKHILGGIQKDLAKCFAGLKFSASSLDNLHITIQLVVPFNPKKKWTLGEYIHRIHGGLAEVPGPFKQWAKGKGWNQPWDFGAKLQSGWLTISKNGTVMLHVAKSDSLVHLGKTIDQELAKVGVKTKRNDVAGKYDAHITLGKIPKDKVADAKARKCGIDFKAKFKGHKFIIDRFVLLQSNRPAKPRHYYRHGEFKLHLG